ncbi:MAG: GNAT family N-acetyltransferase [Kiloniellales bacterium]
MSDAPTFLFVSYLAMTRPPAGDPLPAPLPDARMAREKLSVDSYLTLYRAVGAPWSWDQRLKLPRAALAAFLAGPACDLFVLRLGEEAAGFCEFDSAAFPTVQLMNFGLLPAQQGRSLGPWLLDAALREIWRRNPGRVWLHSDTQDHPKALRTYERAGFLLEERRWQGVTDL